VFKGVLSGNRIQWHCDECEMMIEYEIELGMQFRGYTKGVQLGGSKKTKPTVN